MAALRDPEQIKYLEPFLGKAVSVTEAAKLCSCKPNTMLSRIKRFEHLGLLRVVQTRKRNGRGIKLYTTTSDSFFVELNLDDIVFGHQRWSQHFVEMISSEIGRAHV